MDILSNVNVFTVQDSFFDNYRCNHHTRDDIVSVTMLTWLHSLKLPAICIIHEYIRW